MPYAEVTAAIALIAYIELRVQRTIRESAEQLERDYMDNGGRRRRTQEASRAAADDRRRTVRSSRKDYP